MQEFYDDEALPFADVYSLEPKAILDLFVKKLKLALYFLQSTRVPNDGHQKG